MSTTASPLTEVQVTGRRLTAAMHLLLEAIPGSPLRPTSLAKQLGLSRVTCSKLLGALQRPTLFEQLEAIPGPESLRVAASAAGDVGVNEVLVDEAHKAIDSFAQLVKGQFGTRVAFNAAISGRSDGLRARMDQAGRVEVFRGMRQILGVEASTWLTSMTFAPSPEDEDSVAVTTLHGALGLKRFRTDTEVYFTFGAPYPQPGTKQEFSESPMSFQEFYTHEPATLETSVAGGQLRHRLVQDELGRHAVIDMLALSHNSRSSRRYAEPDAPLRGVSMFVDVPVRSLIVDAIVHRDIFPGCEPELIAYNPGARGPANPNDPLRDADRVSVFETVEHVSCDTNRFDVSEVAHYEQMIDRVCAKIGHSADEFRVYRLQMAYPVNSFQFVVAFKAPQKA